MIGVQDTITRRIDSHEVLHTFAAAAIDSARPTIFVVEADCHSRDGIACALRLEGHAVETFTAGNEFLERMRRFGPACLLVDLHLPDMSGLELQAALLTAGDDIPVIFVADVPDVVSTVTAIKQGAVDYLVRPVSAETLNERVRFAVHQHRSRLKEMVQRREIMFRFGRLTAREREVAALVADGLPNKEIAAHLGTAEKTIKHHRARVMLKLGVESVAQLVRMLDRIGDRSHH